jgi:hypothetical protein
MDSLPVAQRHQANPYHDVVDKQLADADEQEDFHPIVWLPPSFTDQRAELGDHALWLIGLLADPERVRPEGWRELNHHLLRRKLGDHRPGGVHTWRIDELLGTLPRKVKNANGEVTKRPARVGKLDLLVERDASWAGAELVGKENAFSQAFRLRDPSWRQETPEPVQLHLRERERGCSKIIRLYRGGPEVHDHLDESYRLLTVDPFGAREELVRLAGLDPELAYATAAEIAAALDRLPKPELVLVKSGKRRGQPCVEQPPDPRVAFVEALKRLTKSWSLPDEPRRHALFRDRRGHRLHSPLTVLPREFRQFLRLDGQPLVMLDIKSSQPVLGCVLMRREGLDKHEDIRRYMSIAEDPAQDIYDHLHQLTYRRSFDEAAVLDDVDDGRTHQQRVEDLRDAFKEQSFWGLFYCDGAKQGDSPLGKAVKRHYPNLYQHLLDKKAGPLGHGEFCCELQRFEASLVIDTLAPRMAEMRVPLVTIHDAVLIKQPDLEVTRSVFQAVLDEAGARAVLKVKQVWGVGRDIDADRAVELLRGEGLAELPVTPMRA